MGVYFKYKDLRGNNSIWHEDDWTDYITNLSSIILQYIPKTCKVNEQELQERVWEEESKKRTGLTKEEADDLRKTLSKIFHNRREAS